MLWEVRRYSEYVKLAKTRGESERFAENREKSQKSEKSEKSEKIIKMIGKAREARGMSRDLEMFGMCGYREKNNENMKIE